MKKCVEEDFVVRRVFRFGCCDRKDVIEAFDIPPATATRVLTSALSRYDSLVERKGYSIVRKPGSVPPSFADETDLLDSIDEEDMDFARTGLRIGTGEEAELQVVFNKFTNPLPPRPGVFMELVKTAISGRLIRIKYVSLSRGDVGRWRLIAPLSVEKMNDQIRIVAQDMETEGFQLRTFVTSRILDMERFDGKPPKGFVRKSGGDVDSELKVSLSNELTEEQKVILGNELKVKNGKIKMKKRVQFEFKRRFAETPKSENAIWPVLDIEKEPS